MQGVRMSAICTKAQAFHDALVDSDLVSGPIKSDSQRYCSTMSVQTSAAGRSLQLSLGAVIKTSTVTSSHPPSQHSCRSSAGNCDSLCLSAVVLTLSPAVALWNRVFHLFRLSPAGVSSSGCTEVTTYPRIRWEVDSNGMLLFLKWEFVVGNSCCSDDFERIGMACCCCCLEHSCSRLQSTTRLCAGEYSESQAVPADQWILILPQCTEAEVYLRADVAANVYNALYMSAPFVLLCMVATLLVQQRGNSRFLLTAATSANSAHSKQPLPLRWGVPAAMAAVLLSWPQSSMFAKSLATCTGVAAGHLLNVSVHYFLHVCVALLAKLCKNARQSITPSKARRVVLGFRVCTTTALTVITVLVLTFVHVFVGLCAATGILAYSIASEAARAVAIQRVKSYDRDVTGLKEEQQEVENGSAISGKVRVRHQGVPGSIGVPPVRELAQDAASGCAGSIHDHSTSCSCLQSRGHTVISLMLMSSLLALPSAVAAVKSCWLPQAMEDVLPAASIVVWALLLSEACKSDSSQQSSCMSKTSSPSAVLGSCASQSQGICHCKFSQLALSQVSDSCCGCMMCMHH